MTMIGGHPYLVQIALNHLAQKEYTLSGFLQLAPTTEGPYRNHLIRLLENLKQQESDLVPAFKKVLEQNSPVWLDSREKFKLHSMGLVCLKGDEVMNRYELYRQYFRNCELYREYFS